MIPVLMIRFFKLGLAWNSELEEESKTTELTWFFIGYVSSQFIQILPVVALSLFENEGFFSGRQF